MIHVMATVDEIPMGVTSTFGVLRVTMITCLALEEKLNAKKSVIAGVFAVACLLMAATGIFSCDWARRPTSAS